MIHYFICLGDTLEGAWSTETLGERQKLKSRETLATELGRTLAGALHKMSRDRRVPSGCGRPLSSLTLPPPPRCWQKGHGRM